MTEEFSFKDTDCWEELDRCTDKNSDRVEKLDCIDEFVVLGVIRNDLDLRVNAERSIAKHTNSGEDNCDDEHDEVQ